MFCMHCGNLLQDGDKFCQRCGARVEPVAPQPMPVQPVQEEPSTVAPGMSPYAEEPRTTAPQAAQPYEQPAVTYSEPEPVQPEPIQPEPVQPEPVAEAPEEYAPLPEQFAAQPAEQPAEQPMIIFSEPEPAPAEPVTFAPEAAIPPQQEPVSEPYPASTVPQYIPPEAVAAAQAEKKPKKSKKKLIIGLIIGGVALIAAAVVLIVLFVLPKSLKGDYVLLSMTDASGSDYIEYLVSARGENVPSHLEITEDGSGAVNYPDGTAYATISYDKSSLDGTMTIGMDEDALTITNDEAGLSLYDSNRGITMLFAKRDSGRFNAAAGDSVLLKATDTSGNYIRRIIKQKGMPMSKLTLGEDGSGSITCTDSASYASLALTADTMTGTMSYESGDSSSVFVTVSDSGVNLYDTDRHCTYVYAKKGSVDLSAIAGDYLMSYQSTADHDDYLGYLAVNDRPMNTQLTLSADCSGSILYTDGSKHSYFSFSSDDMTGEITYDADGAKDKIFVCVDSDSIAVYDVDTAKAMAFLRKGSLDASSFAGDYVLSGSSNRLYEDYAAYQVSNKYKMVTAMTFNSDNTCRLINEYGELYASVTFDPQTMEGTVTYENNSHKSPAYLACYDGTVTVYDTDLDVRFGFIRKDKVDFTVMAGEYVLAHESDTKYPDRLIYLMENNYMIHSTLIMHDDGTGSILYPDGDEYASIQLKPDSLSCDIIYSNSGRTSAGYITYSTNRVTVYDTEGCIVFSYINRDAIDFESASGDYILSKIIDKDGSDYIDYQVKEGYMILPKLTLNSDGSGKVFFRDGDTYATFELNDGMNGSITYVLSSTTNDLYLTLDKNVITLYDTDYRRTFIYYKSDSVDLTEAEGDYALIRVSNQDTDDYLEKLIKEDYVLIYKLTMDKSGNGKVFFIDGDVQADFTLDPKTMMGKITYTQNKKEHEIFVILDGDNFTLIDPSYTRTSVFARRSKDSLADIEGFHAVKSVVYKDGDYLAALKKAKKKVPSSVSFNKDGSGKITATDGSDYATFTVGDDMICKITYAETKKTTTALLAFSADFINIYDNDAGLVYKLALES